MRSVNITGHGPAANIMEGRRRAGMLGHHPGDVDPPEGVAAFWCPNAPRESCVCLVNQNRFHLRKSRYIKLRMWLCGLSSVHVRGKYRQLWQRGTMCYI